MPGMTSYVDVDVGRDGLQDPQSAVVQRRVAPRQEGADPIGFEFIHDRVGPHLGPPGVPVGNHPPVGGIVRCGSRPWRVGKFDESVPGLADEPVTYQPA